MTDWVVQLVERGGYWGVAFLMFLETVFPPIPSEVIMSLAGLQASKGTMSLPLVIAAGTFGAMVGNSIWFELARRMGVDRFRRLVARHGRLLTLNVREVDKVDAKFDRWNVWFVCAGRMMPTIRSLVSVPAGLFGMGWRPFLIFSAIGTAGWTSALATGGYVLGRNFKQVDAWLGPISTGIIVVLVLWYLYRVFTWKPHAD